MVGISKRKHDTRRRYGNWRHLDDDRHILAQQPRWIFPPNATSPCLVHCRRCPVHPKWVMTKRQKLEWSDVLKSCGDTQQCLSSSSSDGKSRKLLRRASSNAAGGESSWWENLGDIVERPICIKVDGVICTAFSPRGKQRRYLDPTEEVHSIWRAERLASQQCNVSDVDFMECSDAYLAVDRLRVRLPHTTVVHLKLSPVKLGHPHIRNRLHGALICKEDWVWLGPDSDEDIEKEFLELFGRRVVATAIVDSA